MIGGSHQGLNDLENETSTVLFDRLAVDAHIAAEIFPLRAGARINRTWTGTEACTPDGIPAIGKARNVPGLFHSFGHSSHGFQLGAAVAELMARNAANLPAVPFHQNRFVAAA